MNTNKLLSIMTLHGDTQGDLAEAIGVSRNRLSLKIHNKASFTQPEIVAIKKRYDLTCEQLDEIFFSSDVS